VNFVSATEGGSYDMGGHQITWDLGTLLAGESRNLEAVVQVDAGTAPETELTNTASIESDNTVPASDAAITTVCGTGGTQLYVDIKPGSCPNPYNTKSMGKLPVAILGSGDFDVYDIDPATVMLEGVPLCKYSYEDVATPVVDGEPCECNELGGDGYTDLVVHFVRPTLTDALGTVTDAELREVVLTASLYGGEIVSGSDCLLINHRPRRGQAPPRLVLFAQMPGHESAHILLSTEEAGDVSLVIYDVHGRAVSTLLNEYKAAGSYEVIWNGESNGLRVPAGVYFATASNSHGSTTKKFIVVR
jgi:hypothetical protein